MAKNCDIVENNGHHDGHYIDEDEIDLRELFATIKNNYLYILVITTLVVILASVYTYLKPVTYETYAILDMQSNNKQTIEMPDILKDFAGMGGLASDDVDKVLTYSKAFSVNKNVLEKVDFSVRYFEKESFKSHEFYKDSPILIKNLIIKDKNALQLRYTFTPIDKKSFRLSVKNSSLFASNIINKKYNYDQNISLADVSFVVTRDEAFDFDKKCEVLFSGDNRDIYENIIKNRLNLSRLDKKSSFIKISFRDNISQRAEEYVNTLAKLFSQKSIEDKINNHVNMLNSINQQIAEISKALQKSENQLQKYKSEENIEKIDLQSENMVNNITKLDFSEKKLTDQLTTIKVLKKHILNHDDIDTLYLTVSSLGSTNITIQFQQLLAAKEKKRSLSTRFTEYHPDVQEVTHTIAVLEKKIIKNIDMYEESLKSRIQKIENDKRNLQKSLSAYPMKKKKLIDYKREYEVFSQMYTYLLKLKVEKSIALNAIRSNFKMVDKAYTDPTTKKPKSKLIISVATITGMILGIFFIFFKEFLKDTLSSESEFELLGEIPNYKSSELYTELLKDPESKFSDAFRRIRHRLSLLDKIEGNTILVTSKNLQDGKTTTAINLAGVFSNANYKSILINLDLKKPMLHRYFTIDNRYGISNYLKDECEKDDIIFPTLYDNLDVISAGSHLENTTDILMNKKLNLLLNELKSSYDVIVLDTPAIESGADTLEVLHLADEVIFVVKKDQYTNEFSQYLKKFTRFHKIKNLSLVINEVKQSSISFFYKNSFLDKSSKENRDGFMKLLKDLEEV